MVKNITSAGRIQKYNLDFTKDVEHMADLGFEGLSMEPVVGDDLSYAITDDDLPPHLRRI